MFARFLALSAALTFSALADEATSTPLVIYLKASPADAASITYMKLELAKSMQLAGYSIDWPEAPAIPDVRNGRLVVMELEGACTPGAGATQSPTASDTVSLASTPVSGGEILPFHTLHCDALNRLIGRELAATPRELRTWLFGRAMARLAAHELYHFLTGNSVHTREGVSKPCFSAQDLLADRFEFETAALATMRHVEEAVSAATQSGGTEARR